MKKLIGKEEVKKKVSEGLYKYYSHNKSARIGLKHTEKTKKHCF